MKTGNAVVSFLMTAAFAGSALAEDCSLGPGRTRYEQGYRVGSRQARDVFLGDCQNVDALSGMPRPYGSSCIERGMRDGIERAMSDANAQCFGTGPSEPGTRPGTGTSPGECQMTGDEVGNLLGQQACRESGGRSGYSSSSLTSCSVVSVQGCRAALYNYVSQNCPQRLGGAIYERKERACDELRVYR